jgi:hypothetical protein
MEIVVIMSYLEKKDEEKKVCVVKYRCSPSLTTFLI